MKTTLTNAYPLIITQDITRCAAFYTEHFDFDIVFEADWYIQLLSSNGIELGILIEGAGNQPDALKTAYAGSGVVFTFEVENAKAEYEQFKASGTECLLEYTEEDWGQKHFIIQDPAGMFIDIVERTTPEDYQ